MWPLGVENGLHWVLDVAFREAAQTGDDREAWRKEQTTEGWME
jgi:predicted transposase YbfD/YdcC